VVGDQDKGAIVWEVLDACERGAKEQAGERGADALDEPEHTG
jgi:hypothetical protein